VFETNCSKLTCQKLDALFKQSTCRNRNRFDISPWNLRHRNVVKPSLPFLGIANSILSLRLSTNKDMADSLANLDLGGLAEGVPDEAVVVPLTELDMVIWKELIWQGLVGQLPIGDSFEVGPLLKYQQPSQINFEL
jgi:hypothetical protein